MRRILIVLLAIVLPLQFAWAGAAAYCGHEPDGVAARHFGHHSHAHHDGGDAGDANGDASGDRAGPAAKSDGKHGDKPSAYQAPDLDCAVCHLAASTAVPSVADLAPAITGATFGHPLLRALFRSAPDALPDRPQWSRLA